MSPRFRRGLASGNLEIMEFCRVYKVNRTSDSKRVTGVSYFDPQGRAKELEADRVVLGCYALENARLMLASGINRSGEVGKHLTTHAFGFFMGLTPEFGEPLHGATRRFDGDRGFQRRTRPRLRSNGAMGRADHKLVGGFSAAGDRPRYAGRCASLGKGMAQLDARQLHAHHRHVFPDGQHPDYRDLCRP